MANYDSIDMAWTWDGDYELGIDGDLKDTSDDLIQSLRNELHTVLRSEFDDWELHPNIATNISEFRGEPNSREVGTALRERVESRLIAAGIVMPSDLTVKVVPVGASQVMVALSIQAMATPANNLAVGNPLIVTFLYDSMEDGVFFLDRNKNQADYRG